MSLPCSQQEPGLGVAAPGSAPFPDQRQHHGQPRGATGGPGIKEMRREVWGSPWPPGSGPHSSLGCVWLRSGHWHHLLELPWEKTPQNSSPDPSPDPLLFSFHPQCLRPLSRGQKTQGPWYAGLGSW